MNDSHPSILQGSEAALDLEALRRRLGDDDAAVEAVIRAFKREAPAQLAQLAGAVDAEDKDRIRRLAHGLKGALLWIGADEGASSAAALEKASGGEPGARAEAFSRLRQDVERTLAGLSGSFS